MGIGRNKMTEGKRDDNHVVYVGNKPFKMS